MPQQNERDRKIRMAVFLALVLLCAPVPFLLVEPTLVTYPGWLYVAFAVFLLIFTLPFGYMAFRWAGVRWLVTIVVSLSYALWLAPTSPSKQLVRTLHQVRPGMTAADAKRIMAGYVRWEDPRTGTLSFGITPYAAPPYRAVVLVYGGKVAAIKDPMNVTLRQNGMTPPPE